jgi:hypothetical protein
VSLRPELQVAGLSSFAPVVEVRPRVSSAPDARVSGVVLHADGLVFRAEGPGLAPGIYSEDPSGELAPLALDEGELHVQPLARGDVVVAKLIAAGGAPAWPRAVRFLRAGAAPLDVPGQSVGVSGDGLVALVVDVLHKRLTRVALADLSTHEVGALEGGMDPQLAPLVALDEHGQEALLMDAREERCDASLEGIDLRSGERTRLLGPLPAPAFVSAAFLPGELGAVALVVEHGERPLARLLVLDEKGAREAWRAAVAQPASVPCVVGPTEVALPLSVKSHGPAHYGPVDLVVVSLKGKAAVPLTQSGEVTGQARLIGRTLIVEGGCALLRAQRRWGAPSLRALLVEPLIRGVAGLDLPRGGRSRARWRAPAAPWAPASCR